MPCQQAGRPACRSPRLAETEPDVIGRAYEYLLRLYAAGKGKTAGEFHTPAEVAFLMAYSLNPKEKEEIYDPAVGSGGLLIKNHLVFKEKLGGKINQPKFNSLDSSKTCFFALNLLD